MLARICLYIITLTTLSCSPNLTDHNDKKFVVIGTALNAKGAAVVVTDSGHYYLEGLDSWDEKYYGKQVKVTGTLRVTIHERESTDTMERQEIVGRVSTIEKPEWKLVE
jgi:hypothetical protein